MTGNSGKPEQRRTSIAIGVVRRGDEVLVGRRAAGQVLAGKDEFPGGKQLPTESLEEAVRRECLEETGLEVVVGRLMLATTADYPHGLLTLSFFACEPADPQVVPRSPWVWIPIGQLSRLDFPSANRGLLDLLAAEGTGGNVGQL